MRFALLLSALPFALLPPALCPLGAAAAAVSLSGNPYVKAPPYQPPPLAHITPSPAGRASRGAERGAFRPPAVQYTPPRGIDPSRAVNHRQWCMENHPSYRPADNSYRPFDKSGAPLPGRLPCSSPYSR